MFSLVLYVLHSYMMLKREMQETQHIISNESWKGTGTDTNGWNISLSQANKFEISVQG